MMVRILAAVLLLVMASACITRVETSFDDEGPVKVDGTLDCTSPVQWSLQGTPVPDAVGSATAEQALREELGRWMERFGGEIEITDDDTGSLVIDGREQVVSVATKTQTGGWLVTTTSGCENFELN